MIGRLWNWIVGHQKVDVNINIKIENSKELLKVLTDSLKNPVIIATDRNDVPERGSFTYSNKATPKETKSTLLDDPATSKEIADIMLSSGIAKAVDKTGGDVVSASEGNSTDGTVSSLKKMLKGDK